MKYRTIPGSGASLFQKNSISPEYQCSIDASFQRGRMGIGVYFHTSITNKQIHSVCVQCIGRDSTEAELYGLYYAMQYALSHNMANRKDVWKWHS